MKSLYRIFLYLGIGMVLFFFLFPSPASAQTQTHPFMIVKPSMYAELRSRATQSPWKEMKQDAINDCLNLPAFFEPTWNVTINQYLRNEFAMYDSLQTQFSASDPTHISKAQGFIGWSMRDIAASCALAYILDDPNRLQYKTKLLSKLPYWTQVLEYQKGQNPSQPPDGWSNQIPVASAFMNTLIALDVMYNDFSAAELAPGGSVYTAEQSLRNVRDFYSGPRFFYPANFAVFGMWDLYNTSTGNRHSTTVCNFSGWNSCDFAEVIGNYHYQLLNNPHDASFSISGTHLESPAYAFARFASVRDAKILFTDVLEFTGKVPAGTYYNNTKLKNFYEWLYGYAPAPNGKFATFGDTASFQGIYDYDQGSHPAIGSRVLNSFKFSQSADNYAAWRAQNQQFEGRILTYVMSKATPAANPQLPPSRIFTDGGAFFQHPDDKILSLYGALWNPKNSAGHNHKDVNAIYLAGYGEVLMSNSGYGDLNGFSGTYRSERAVSNNVVLINYQPGTPQNPSATNDHNLKMGGGIAEGFTVQNVFDYASGDSRFKNEVGLCCTPPQEVLPNGHHDRNFLFIHPQDGAPGYFTLFDEVQTTNSSDPVNVVLHPYSDTITTVAANQEYQAKIGPNKLQANKNVFISIFYGTSPQSVSQIDGVFADFWKPLLHKYLFATFNQGSRNPKQIVTILFPHDDTHAKATMTRITAASHTGAKINLSTNIIDTALESAGTQTETEGSVSFKARATHYRTISGNLVSYFVRKGTNFSDGATSRTGFDSNNPVSLYLKYGAGSITSTGASITFYHPGITAVKLNGQTLIPTSQGAGWKQVTVPSGTHSIVLEPTNGNLTPPPSTPPSPTSSVPQKPCPLDGDTNTCDGRVNILDYSYISSKFGTNDKGADVQPDGIINVLDYTILSNNFGRVQ